MGDNHQIGQRRLTAKTQHWARASAENRHTRHALPRPKSRARLVGGRPRVPLDMTQHLAFSREKFIDRCLGKRDAQRRAQPNHVGGGVGVGRQNFSPGLMLHGKPGRERRRALVSAGS